MHTRLGFGLILATLLLLAQAAGIAHAYEHEAGAPQNQTCPLCVTAGELESACIDISLVPGIEPQPFSPFAAPAQEFCTTRGIAVRQRGPPPLT